jgi:WD40 repeat protein
MRSAILNRLFSIFLISFVFLIFSKETGYGAAKPGNSNPEIIVQGPSDNVELVTFSKDGRFIATSSKRTVNIWQFSVEFIRLGAL